jgi:ABC-type branched-subunit amino acid transport system substrate-binding protein
MTTSCFANLQNDHVFAGAFFVGTPTAARYVPMAEASHLPLVGLFTGAELLYSPFHHYVMNVRASYYDETRAQVDKLWAVGIRKLAVIYPNDAFGAAVLEGVKIALKRHAATPAVTANYPRNTTQVESAVKVVQAADPQAVVLVGPYGPVAAMLHKSRERSWNPVFLSVSFVDTDDLIREAGASAEGVIVTQVMPSCSAVDLPMVALYRQQLEARSAGARLGYVSLEPAPAINLSTLTYWLEASSQKLAAICSPA